MHLGGRGKASPKVMLEGSSKYKQEAEGEGRERALEAEDRAEANGGAVRSSVGLEAGSSVGLCPWQETKLKRWAQGGARLSSMNLSLSVGSDRGFYRAVK